MVVVNKNSRNIMIAISNASFKPRKTYIGVNINIRAIWYALPECCTCNTDIRALSQHGFG